MAQVWYIFFFEIEHVFQKHIKLLHSAVSKPDNFSDLVFLILLYLMEAVDPEKNMLLRGQGGPTPNFL